MPLDVDHWRARAEQARTVAEWISNAEAKTLLLEVAERYERIAQIATASALALAPTRTEAMRGM
jgi:hypothetical protein